VQNLVRRIAPWDEVWATLSHLYAFDNEMTLRALYYLRQDDQDWIINDQPMTPEVIANIPLDEYKSYHFRPESVAALRRLARDLKTRGIEPVLYIAPFHPYFHKLVPGYAQWVNALQRELVHRLGGCPPVAAAALEGLRGTGQPEGAQTAQATQPVGQAPQTPEHPPEINVLSDRGGVLTPSGTLVWEPALDFSHTTDNLAIISGFSTPGAERPRKTSAPAITSPKVRALVSWAKGALYSSMSTVRPL